MFFVLKSTHDRVVADLIAERDAVRRDLKTERATSDALDRTARKYRAERDDYKAKYDRMTAPLRAANAARAARKAVPN